MKRLPFLMAVLAVFAAGCSKNNPTTPAVRKGVKALDDFQGGAEGAQLYGTFTRNAHEWDIAG